MHVKSALVIQIFAILRDFRALTVLEITLALVCVVAVPTDEKDKGNTGNINSNGGNIATHSITSFFRPMSKSK